MPAGPLASWHFAVCAIACRAQTTSSRIAQRDVEQASNMCLCWHPIASACAAAGIGITRLPAVTAATAAGSPQPASNSRCAARHSSNTCSALISHQLHRCPRTRHPTAAHPRPRPCASSWLWPCLARPAWRHRWQQRGAKCRNRGQPSCIQSQTAAAAAQLTWSEDRCGPHLAVPQNRSSMAYRCNSMHTKQRRTRAQPPHGRTQKRTGATQRHNGRWALNTVRQACQGNQLH